MQDNQYTQTFYQDVERGAKNSAKIILPFIHNLINFKSIVDFGCGNGSWLSVCQSLKITDYMGIEGEWILSVDSLVSKKKIVVKDLNFPVLFERTYDLAICMEVAEHLEESSATIIVHSLTKASDYVLFSAAIPNQGGNDHVNEQWQDYWIQKFADENYVVVDVIRSNFWQNEKIEYWYRQNAFLFVKHGVLKRNKQLSLLATKYASIPARLVHPHTFTKSALISRPIEKMNNRFPILHSIRKIVGSLD